MIRLYLPPTALATLAVTVLWVAFQHPLTWWAWPLISAGVIAGAVAAVGFINLADPPEDAEEAVVEPVAWPEQDYQQEAA